MEFSIMEIIELLRKHIRIIAICTMAGLCIFFIFSKFIISPTYTATVQLYVDPQETTPSAGLTELNYAQKVVTTYMNFLRTKVFNRMVIEDCKLNYTASELQNMTTIQSVNNTEIFEISVNSYNPSDSYGLVKSMQNIAPKLIKSIKGSAKISVIDPVVLPTGPTSPNILLNTLIGGILGFILSVLFVLLWEILDVNVKNQDDLVKKYSLPVLGSIPSFELNKQNKINIRKYIPILRKRIIQKNSHVKIDDETKFVITEAYKSLRTNLRFTLRNEGCKKVIISSPVPEEGKSTTSINLGITFAQTGARVLLMDCDLRKGSLHRFFNLKSRPGVSDVLSGMYDVKNIIQSTSYVNLNIIPLGIIPPNPTELLASTQMVELISKLEKDYDYIIIDTPPVNIVSDTLSLSKLVDGILIVVRESVTSHPNIINTINKYKFVEANLLGFVINGVSLEDDKKSKTKYHYYKYANHD